MMVRVLALVLSLALSTAAAAADLAFYYSRVGVNLITRFDGVNTTENIGQIVCDGAGVKLRYIANPFGQDVDVYGITLYVTGNGVGGFMSFQRGSDWTFIGAPIITETPLPSGGTAINIGVTIAPPMPVRLAAGDTILEEIKCPQVTSIVDGQPVAVNGSRVIGVTIYARTVQ